MSDERHELIRYAGKWAAKDDPFVPGRRWLGPPASHYKPGPGVKSMYRVPASLAEKYLAFGDEFQRVTPLYLCSEAGAALSEEEQVWALHQIVLNLPRHACEELQAALAGRIAELVDMGKVPASPEERVRFRDRFEKIAAAVAQMDPLENSHFTDLGRPRVAVVRRLAELDDVTAEEIAEVVRQTKG